MFFTKRTFIKLNLVLICLSWSHIATASDDAYLDAMEAEAQSSETTKKTSLDNKETDLKQSISNKQQLEFEARLSKELPASFRTYNKLTKENKQNIVSIYFETNKNMPISTRALFSLYFKQ